MKASAIIKRTNTVKSSGTRLMLLSTQRRFHSALWFFFITMARRKGEISTTVSRPVRALAYQCNCQPGSRLRISGSTKVNIMAMVAAERME